MPFLKGQNKTTTHCNLKLHLPVPIVWVLFDQVLIYLNFCFHYNVSEITFVVHTELKHYIKRNVPDTLDAPQTLQFLSTQRAWLFGVHPIVPVWNISTVWIFCSDIHVAQRMNPYFTGFWWCSDFLSCVTMRLTIVIAMKFGTHIKSS